MEHFRRLAIRHSELGASVAVPEKELIVFECNHPHGWEGRPEMDFFALFQTTRGGGVVAVKGDRGCSEGWIYEKSYEDSAKSL